MLTYSLEARGGLPLYEYLYRCIRRDILDGTLAADERLPSKRALAEHLHVSVITVEGAYQQLEAEGYLYTRPKRGFFVSQVERTPAAAVPAALPAQGEPPRIWKLDLKSNQVDTGPDSSARFSVRAARRCWGRCPTRGCPLCARPLPTICGITRAWPSRPGRSW